MSNGDLGTILGVWGHPDDEAYLAGGLMAAAVDAGRRAVCVTATRGEAGFPDDDQRSHDERRTLREAELTASLAIIGVSEHHWLDYADGGCHLVDVDEPVALIRSLIEEVRPDTVLTFGPDGMTFHDDHIAVGRWTTLAFRQAGVPGMRLLYATKTRDWVDQFIVSIDPDRVMMVEGSEPPATAADQIAVHFVLDDGQLDRKVRALKAQASQVGTLLDQVGEAGFGDFNRDEFFRRPTPADWP